MSFATATPIEPFYLRTGTPLDLTSGLTGPYADGVRFANDGKTLLHVLNGGAEPIIVTVNTPGTIEGLAIADRTYTVEEEGETRIGSGNEYLLGPFSPIYNQLGTQEVYATFSATNGVMARAVRLVG